MSELIKTYPNKLYFVTLTVEGWVNVFDRSIYKDLLVQNLQYCQHNEGLQLYAYVIMSNHMHMVAARETGELGDLLGRFKSVTAKEILKLIATHPQESRKDWMLNVFKHFAVSNAQYSDFHFWNYTNHPVDLWSRELILQKSRIYRIQPCSGRYCN
jgi:putative transposase